MDPQSAQQPEIRLGHYVLVQEVGRGAVSTVYEARDLELGRTVALKVLDLPRSLQPGQDEDRIARLKREARAMARLSHPNIVTVHELAEQDGTYYLVMEFLDGTTLRDRMNGGPIPPEEAAEILAQIAAGLDAVHRQGLLHRDIKPSNVMLLYNGQVKLLDFGVARATDDAAMTQTGAVIGSPAYLAPEQLADGPVTPAADIWSLGILLYEMLAGRLPFPAASVPGVMYKIAHTKPAPLPGVSPGVQDVLRRALEKDPAKRFPSAHALSDAFSAAVKGRTAPQSIPAVPAPPTEVREKTLRLAASPQRVSRRSRWPVAAAGALCLAALAGLVWGRARRLPPHSLPSGTARVVLNPAAPSPPWPPVRRVVVSPVTPPVRPQTVVSHRRRRPAPQILAENRSRLTLNSSFGASERLPLPSIQPVTPLRDTAPTSPVPSGRRVSRLGTRFYRRPPDAAAPPLPDRKAVTLAQEVPSASPLLRKRQSPASPPASPRQIALAPTPKSVSLPHPETGSPPEDIRPARRAVARTWRYQEKTPEEAAVPPPAEKPAPSPEANAPETGAEDSHAFDPEADRIELTRQLRRWITATNTGNIDAQMRFYPRRVSAFYLKHDVSRDDVRAEKERVFDNANVIAIHASDPIIYLSDDGQEAVMRFRKRYTIAGWDKWRHGEVLQELRWRRTRQGWKIVGERDLRVLADR
ncbi:MAG TPA: protein kinase [Chthonomonadaceae bacterium]|nr:protein kinase [Chthonomonadaceae bacterium]